MYELFPRLAERASNRGNQLSGGEQQMLAIGRALIGNPTVLLMDEPSEGLAPVIVEELARAVKRLTQAGGLSTMLVEQNSRLALDIAPRAVVMDRGRIVYDGASETLRNDPARLEQLIGCRQGVVTSSCDAMKRSTRPHPHHPCRQPDPAAGLAGIPARQASRQAL